MEILLSLAESLRSRYLISADLATLDEAIEHGRDAVAEASAGHVHRAAALASLATSLALRHGRTGDEPNLVEAIELCGKAVAATPPEHADRGPRLSLWSSFLLTRFEQSRDRADLAAARDKAEAAVAATPPGHPSRADVLGAYAAALRHELEPDQDVADLERAVAVCREAVAATSEEHPSRPARLTELALALDELGQVRSSDADLLAAVDAARAAAGTTTAPPSIRLQAARTWGELAAKVGRWPEAAAGFQQAVRLLPLVAPRNLARLDLEHQLGGLGQLAGMAAAAALSAGEVATALESLENGRATLLSYALDSRAEPRGLRDVEPELVDEWERLRDQLDGVTTAADSALRSDLRDQLANEWDQLLDRIRSVPGFARFLVPSSVRELGSAAEDGPVVSLNVSDRRCDALILTTDDVRHVRLTGLSASELECRLDSFLAATEAAGSGDRDSFETAQDVVGEHLAWLWETTVGPVLDELGFLAAPAQGRPLPRVWWSPTGALNFLPLHAAGHIENGPNALDRVISSYTPSIRALQHTRARRAVAERRLLAVGLVETAQPDTGRLPNAGREARAVDELLAGPGPMSSATRADVLAALPWASWAHFACHSEVDPRRPSDSRLRLWDQGLSVLEISALRLANAELAYLSACATSRGGVDLPNEAIHMVSAFQLAGFRHVIGTLWPVLDSASLRMARSFYQGILAAASPAEVLHSSTLGLRAAYQKYPSVWAGYVHVGA